MKYALGLVLGIASGAFVAVLFVLFNPLTAPGQQGSVDALENDQLVLNYSAVAEDAIVYTNDGESRISPRPARVLQLWEPSIRNSNVAITMLTDEQGVPNGIGIKFSSRSEETNILNGKAMIDSFWHIYLPGRGTMVVGQSENYFDYLRQIVVPAHWSSGKNWKGNWRASTTAGPGLLGTAGVAGGSGEFAGLDTEAVETMDARAYSADTGPVSVEGQLAIDLPRAAADLASDSR